MFDQVVRGIHVRESEEPVDLVNMTDISNFLICDKFTKDFRLRRVVANKIARAEKKLPNGWRFVIYEAFRPRSRQIELWDAIMIKLKNEHPNWTEEQYVEQGCVFVANPHGFGSGHQAGAAVDITICDATGKPFFMGTEVQEFSDKTKTENTLISAEVIKLRKILKDALESEGVINYPDEWWHFSYGDRLWAEVTSRTEAFFAPID